MNQAPNTTHNDEMKCATGTGHELLVWVGPRTNEYQPSSTQTDNEKEVPNHLGRTDSGTPGRKITGKKSPCFCDET